MCLLKDELMITRLDDNISYIEPTVNPLSANVVIINGKDAVWLYDVGSHPDIPDMLYDYITKSKVTVDDEVSLQRKKLILFYRIFTLTIRAILLKYVIKQAVVRCIRED